MPESEPEFQTVISALNQAGARYVIIGGLAMAVHGASHVTYDIDVCYAREQGNFKAVADAIAPYHPSLAGLPKDLPFIFDSRSLSSSTVLTLDTDVGRIDLLGEVAGVSSFQELWDRAVQVKIGAEDVRVAALDDLIAMKEAAGRPKDQVHLLELRALRALIP